MLVSRSISVTPGTNALYAGGTSNKTALIQLKLPSTLELVKTLSTTAADRSVGEVTVTYKSDRTSVATVDSKGKITAKGAGKATISTTVHLYDGKTKTYHTVVTVKKPYIKISKSKSTMKLGESYQFEARAYGLNTQDITWTTTEKSVIVINKITGLAAAKSKGTDYIVAKIGKISVKIKVIVR